MHLILKTFQFFQHDCIGTKWNLNLFRSPVSNLFVGEFVKTINLRTDFCSLKMKPHKEYCILSLFDTPCTIFLHSVVLVIMLVIAITIIFFYNQYLKFSPVTGNIAHTVTMHSPFALVLINLSLVLVNCVNGFQA